MYKVFFSCSMRGSLDSVHAFDLQKIPAIIESAGAVLVSKHQTQKDAVKKEDQLEPHQILERNIKLLKESDIFIAEISNPSIGVGIEIEMARNLNKPILCLFNSQIDEKKISALIRGMVGVDFKVNKYSDLQELKNIVRSFI